VLNETATSADHPDMTDRQTRIYWHRDLPPLDADAVAEHTVDAVSDKADYHFDRRDELWHDCAPSLRAHLVERLEAELDRLGGAYAHVLEEDVTPHVDHANAQYWLIGKARYTIYKRT